MNILESLSIKVKTTKDIEDYTTLRMRIKWMVKGKIQQRYLIRRVSDEDAEDPQKAKLHIGKVLEAIAINLLK